MLFGTRILEQADVLARFSESDGCITRTYLSDSHQRAAAYLIELMQQAGMQTSVDALGNVVGRYAGMTDDAATILCGSHQDSVVDAGRYDGIFGILSPIACISELNRHKRRLPYAIEVVAFGDEEGVRFDVTMIGSAAMAGRFDQRWLDKQDAAGITMAEALRRFGGNPANWQQVQRDPGHIACFVESHIEQGPVLLDAGLPVGVVTAIAGVSRVRANVIGLAGHAGTVPMPLRHDALTAAAEMTLAAEELAMSRADRIVATVGKFNVAAGGAINVIPGRIQFTVDLRSGDDEERRRAAATLQEHCQAIAQRRGVKLEWEVFFELNAAPCDAVLKRQLGHAISKRGITLRELASGAGHDAMKFDGVVPIAMLFVRCGNGGISHNPAEIMSAEDADLATLVLLDFFEHFDASELARRAA
jgi:hydantoinase/carbamoylase family amidase